ncbi:ATP-binding protein [Candidatus Woesearchaeota archaeon]|nr:ATP-binding protein [Candidatus Woesearchaeota archaeon]
MTLELLLERDLLVNDMNIAKITYRDQLHILKEAARSKFSFDIEKGNEAKTLVDDAGLLFAGTYTSLESKVAKRKPFTSAPDEFKRSYLTFVAAEGVLQYIAKDEDIEISKSFKRPEVSFNQGNYNLISDVMEGMTRAFEESSLGNSAIIAANYLASVRDEALKKVLRKQALKKDLQNYAVISDFFAVEGIGNSTTTINPTTDEKPLAIKEKSKIVYDPISLTKNINLSEPVLFEQIIGNKDAIEHVFKNVRKLLTYDSKLGFNPEQKIRGLNQLIMLTGMPGSGKSMIGQAAVHYALGIAKKYNKEVEIVKFDFDTAWKSGETQILEHQLNYITQPDKIRIVFLDEADKYFPSRNETIDQNIIKTINTFLQIDNPAIYPNAGNYLILTTTNRGKNIDPAIMDRYARIGGVHFCNGPETAKERIKLIKQYLKKHEVEQYINITDWNEIGRRSDKVSARALSGVAELVKGEVYKDNEFIEDDVYFNSDGNQVIDIIKKDTQKVGQEQMYSLIHRAKELDEKLNKLNQQFRGSA